MLLAYLQKKFNWFPTFPEPTKVKLPLFSFQMHWTPIKWKESIIEQEKEKVIEKEKEPEQEKVIEKQPEKEKEKEPEKEKEKQLLFSSERVSYHMIPHPEKVKRGGEDACYVSLPKNVLVMAVADGVGGWNHFGVDPSHYANAFIQGVESQASDTFIHPQVILKKAYEFVSEKRIKGGCTACVVTLNGDYLFTATLGDSAYMIIRPYPRLAKIIHKSKEQRTSFNKTLQFAYPVEASDKPEDAIVEVTHVQKNDIIIVATDGLFDNLFSGDIIEILKDCTDTTQEMARKIIESAREIAGSKISMSPFAIAAEKMGHTYDGGKLDDISLIVARI